MTPKKNPPPNDADKPWIGNYPPLKEWLHKIKATCLNQLPSGDHDRPFAMLEMWQANGRVFLILIHSFRHGWDIYTAGETNKIDDTLLDAERRLGIQKS